MCGVQREPKKILTIRIWWTASDNVSHRLPGTVTAAAVVHTDVLQDVPLVVVAVASAIIAEAKPSVPPERSSNLNQDEEYLIAC